MTHAWLVQLEKYRVPRVQVASSAPIQPKVVTSDSDSSGSSFEAFSKYGIAATDDEEDDDAPHTQTVADEMAAYLESPRAARGTDTLSFWSVSELISHYRDIECSF